MIDEYSLLKCIGKGAFGEVYLTSKIGSNQFFATKKVSKQKADSPAIKKYFINEITILREIHHKNIIHFETIKHTIHNYYIITEFCNGGGLSDCLKRYKLLYGTAFPEEIVQYLMRQIVEALKYLHGKRIIHRDLKLDNILVTFENEYDKNNLNMLKAQIKLIDFGFATHLDATNLRYSTLGSPINMDPILLKKLTAAHSTANLIGYDEKADIWSLGTVCYELLIGQGVFNAETMVDLVRKVEFGNYHVPTNLSREVVSFLNGMLQYSARNRLSAEELSRHYFLTKNIKDFKHIDLTKISHKLDYKGLNINIKRNQSIWAIFKEEDEKALIDIPGKYLVDNPIPEVEDEYSQYSKNTNIIKDENPFKKANNTPTIINNDVNNQIINPKEKEIDYNALKQQQKLYYQLNLQNNNNKRYVNYAYNNQYDLGTVNTYQNFNNYYVNGQPKYYNANLKGKKNVVTNPQPVAPIQTIPTVNNAVYQVPQNNQLLVNNQMVLNPQTQQYQYITTYTTQPLYTVTIPKTQKAQIPVPAPKKVIQQVYQQPTPQIPIKNYKNQNIQVQKPIIIPDSTNKYDKNGKNKIHTSKISAITSATTKTEVIPPGTKIPKYENYENFYKMIDLENFQQEIKYDENKKIITKQNIQPKTTQTNIQEKYHEPKSQTKQVEIKQSPQTQTYIQQPEIYTQYHPKAEKSVEQKIKTKEKIPVEQYQTQPYTDRTYDHNHYEQPKKYKEYNEYNTQKYLKKNSPQIKSHESKYHTKTYNKDNSPGDLQNEEPKNNLRNHNEVKYLYQNNPKAKDINRNINDVKILNINSNSNPNKYKENYEQKNYDIKHKKVNEIKIKKLNGPIDNIQDNYEQIYNDDLKYEEINYTKINKPIVIEQTKKEQNYDDYNYNYNEINYTNLENPKEKYQNKKEQNYIEQPNYEEINYTKIENHKPKEIHKNYGNGTNYEYNNYTNKEEEIQPKKIEKFKNGYEDNNYTKKEEIHQYKSDQKYKEYHNDLNYEDNNYRKRDEEIQPKKIQKYQNGYKDNNNYTKIEEIRQHKSGQKHRNINYDKTDYKKINNQTEIQQQTSDKKYKKYYADINYESNNYKQNNSFEIKQSKSNKKNIQNKDDNIYNKESDYSDPFPMPDSNEVSPFEKEKKQEKDYNTNQEFSLEKSKKDGDSSDELDELIDFKLGDELCPEPDNNSDNEKKNDFNDIDNDNDDNIDLPMKKIMERTVERPTIGVPPPGTDLNEDFNNEDDYENGVFQTNYRRRRYDDNDDYN